MTLTRDLLAQNDAPLACVTAIESALGNETMFAVGVARDSSTGVLSEGAARMLAMRFEADGVTAEVAIAMAPRLAGLLEASASGESLERTCANALGAAARALAGDAPIDFTPPREIDANTLENLPEVVVFPILDGEAPVGYYAASLHAIAGAGSEPPASTAPHREPAAPRNSTSSGNSSAPLVLADVEMGVTAELGRCNLTVRDLLTITPGTVIDLDRGANELVDVLVNGTRIARGEVVVIDEEFAIRISEIVTG